MQLVTCFLCSYAGIIILLSFILILLMTAISSLKDQYGCISFWTSAFVAGWPYNTYFNNTSMCSSSRIGCNMSSAVVHSMMLAHVSITFMFTVIMYISSPLFILQLCLDNQPAVNSFGPGLYRILMLY